MGKSRQTFGCIVTVLALSFAAWVGTRHSQTLSSSRILTTYQTSPTRSSASNAICEGFSRTQLSAGSTSQYIGTVSSDIGIDGIAIFNQIKDGQNQQTNDQLRNNNQFIAFLVVFIIGFLLLLLLFPFLCCFCLCPGTCPCLCRKDRSVPFEKADFNCPLLFAQIFLLFALIAGIYGAIESVGTREAFRKASCSGAILTDDLRNGNVTNDGSSYFMGLNQVPILLEQLRTNLTTIDNNLVQLYSNTSNTTLNQAITQSQTALDDTVKISNNDAAGNPLTLQYNTPLDNTVTTIPIPSTFPTVLGSTSTNSGLVQVLHTTISVFQLFLNTLQTNAQNFNTNLNSFDSGLSTAVTNSTTLKDSINNGLGNTDQFLTDSQQVNNNYGTALIVYWIVTVIFIFFCMIAAFCTLQQKSSCCRKTMYSFCFILFLSTLVGFVMSTVYSVTLPVAVWGCQYYEQTISSQFNFQNNLGFAFDATTLQQMGVCMPFGNGNIFEQIAGTTNYNYFNSLNNVFSDINTFSLTGFLNPIFNAQNNLLTTTDDYALGRLMDITDLNSLTILNSLASPTSGVTGVCTNLASDSWVPSNSQNQQSSYIINCTITNGNQGTATTCSAGVGLTSIASGCSGCMDSSQALYQYVNSSATLLVDLTSRYAATCSFTTKLNNVWTNYYQVKLAALGPTVGATSSTTGVFPRIKTVQSDITTLNSTVDPNLPTVFSNINTNLASISSITDPTFGVLGGLNCSVLGQDAVRVQKTACGQMIDHMYVARIATGIVSYFLLLSLCLVVCFGNRHARFQEQTSGSYDRQNLYMNPQPAMYSSQNLKQYN